MGRGVRGVAGVGKGCGRVWQGWVGGVAGGGGACTAENNGSLLHSNHWSMYIPHTHASTHTAPSHCVAPPHTHTFPFSCKGQSSRMVGLCFS